ncbi:helix-turn-helix domain-containing protein [Microbulbifer halophilus]|uniref:Helix-turn-helix domain-containing protein n=1 Tax=Microbulbifer halophilus TaxID=453963 RepID=A0ABW5EFR7_9GAMM|nr:helix-turn-helix transcriptional regulator [Microbulbifer halophilus]MCW8125110.1 helix-turn-helix transcriptional regulator [Microbulbifer halophilus]
MFGSSLHSPEYDNLREWLKRTRGKSGLSQRALSNRLGLHHSIVGKLESGERKFELYEFIRYCEAINADPEEAFRAALNWHKKAKQPVF